ncbi:conserved Plasmodium protein, unknown function [Plasmodium gaboni]|uniref:Uncharacterized protein n=1 Tax=Plasmodium gaboni TaxID=647221 RepID=A0ABY1UTB8_9APIC|nr:conserved Plasmodium protein, unknown function [Plasmodium gaboni]
MYNKYRLYLLNQINPTVNTSSYKQHQLNNDLYKLKKKWKKIKCFLTKVRKIIYDKMDILSMDTLKLADEIKTKIIAQQLHTVLVLYLQILKEKKIQEKNINDDIGQYIENVITSALQLYSLIEKQTKDRKKCYIKKICQLCNTLSNILIEYIKNIKGIPVEHNSSKINENNQNLLINSLENSKKELKETSTRSTEISKEKNENVFEGTCGNISTVSYPCGYVHSQDMRRKKISLQNEFSNGYRLMCLYSAQELNEQMNYNKKVIKNSFKTFQKKYCNIKLRDRRELIYKFAKILENKNIQFYDIYYKNVKGNVVSNQINNIAQEFHKDLYDHGTYNNSNHNITNVDEKGISHLINILLHTNKSITTFEINSQGKIDAVIQFLQENGRKKDIILLNEYEYFFTNTDDYEQKDIYRDKENVRCNNKMIKRNFQNIDDRNNTNIKEEKETIYFYVGNKKKIVFDVEKKQKIVYEIDEKNSLLTKKKFIKDKNNKDILLKVYNENDWSDENMEFCYITEKNEKEKIVIQKNKHGKKKTVYTNKNNELDNNVKDFKFYKKNIKNVKEIHFYDDEEVILSLLKQNEKRKKLEDRKNNYDIKNMENIIWNDDNISVYEKNKIQSIWNKTKNNWANEKDMYVLEHKYLENNNDEMNIESLDIYANIIKTRKQLLLKKLYLDNQQDISSFLKKDDYFKKHRNNTGTNTFDKCADDYKEVYEKNVKENMEITNKYIENKFDNIKVINDNNKKNHYSYNNYRNNIFLESYTDLYLEPKKKKKEKKQKKDYAINTMNTLISADDKKIISEEHDMNDKEKIKIEDFLFNQYLKKVSVSSQSLKKNKNQQEKEKEKEESKIKKITYDTINMKEDENVDVNVDVDVNINVDVDDQRKIDNNDNIISNEKNDILQIDDIVNKDNKYIEFDKYSKNCETHNNLFICNNHKDNISDKNNKMIDKNLLKKKKSVKMNSFNSDQKLYDSDISNVMEKKIYNETKISDENIMKNQRYEDDKKRRKYLSEGFSAYVHIALCEDTIISKKCIISCNVNTKMLKIKKNDKIFTIDMNKLDVQEIPTTYDNLAIIKLIIKKKNNSNSNCLLVESKNLKALQYLGDEIGWNYDKTGYSTDHKLDDQKERKKTDDGHKNNKSQLIDDNSIVGFFDKIKLNKFLGKKKTEEKDI